MLAADAVFCDQAETGRTTVDNVYRHEGSSQWPRGDVRRTGGVCLTFSASRGDSSLHFFPPTTVGRRPQRLQAARRANNGRESAVEVPGNTGTPIADRSGHPPPSNQTRPLQSQPTNILELLPATDILRPPHWRTPPPPNESAAIRGPRGGSVHSVHTVPAHPSTSVVAFRPTFQPTRSSLCERSPSSLLLSLSGKSVLCSPSSGKRRFADDVRL
jgi:hypothetical protein